MNPTKTGSEQGDYILVKVLKISDNGYNFNRRLIYTDKHEIRYYSKQEHDFIPNNIRSVKKPPKTGIPTKLCEFSFASESWSQKHNMLNSV